MGEAVAAAVAANPALNLSWPDPATTGRPITFTQEIAARFLAKVAAGGLVTEIAKEPGMPARSTWYEWMTIVPGLADAYARAREMQAHAIAEEGLASATKAMEPEKVQAARLAFDARKWFAAKMAPRVYGDRVDLVRRDGTDEELTDDELRAIARGSGGASAGEASGAG